MRKEWLVQRGQHLQGVVVCTSIGAAQKLNIFCGKHTAAMSTLENDTSVASIARLTRDASAQATLKALLFGPRAPHEKAPTFCNQYACSLGVKRSPSATLRFLPFGRGSATSRSGMIHNLTSLSAWGPWHCVSYLNYNFS